jgi:hypothetical protein
LRENDGRRVLFFGLPFLLGILVGSVIGVALSATVDAIWFPGEGHYVHHW